VDRGFIQYLFASKKHQFRENVSFENSCKHFSIINAPGKNAPGSFPSTKNEEFSSYLPSRPQPQWLGKQKILFMPKGMNPA